MRYRDYKSFTPGHYYHIFNRGVNKQKIFIDEQDYFQFLQRLQIILALIPMTEVRTNIRPLPQGSFSILAYCLMPTHFHMLIRQNNDIGIGKLILKLCTSYSTYMNKKYNRVGTLFQDRFKAKLVDSDQYATYVSAYINNNPENPNQYPYSSYKEIFSSDLNTILDRRLLLSWFNNSPQAYKKFVDDLQKHKALGEFSFSN